MVPPNHRLQNYAPAFAARRDYVIEDIFTSFPMSIKYEVYADHHESTWSLVSRLQSALAGVKTEWTPISAEESRLVAWIGAVFLTRGTVVFVKQ